MSTWKELVKYGADTLAANSVDDAQFEAFQLALPFFDDSKDKYLFEASQEAENISADAYKGLIQRRIDGEPLQYILGKWDFFESTFFVGKGVLIPRPETEELVAHCIELIKTNRYKVIYDLCTGSGCIGLSVALACPDVQVYLFELYDEAFSYAEKNLMNLSPCNVKLVRADVLEGPVDGIPCADMIISNPPYIESSEISSLQQEVLKEPLTALDGGEDGLIFYRAFYEKWDERLNASGCFAFECGERQTDDIIRLSGRAYESYSLKDMYDNERFVFSRKL